MSINRNKKEDLRRTIEESNNRTIPIDGKNWLGHGEYTSAAMMDELLISGATFEDFLKYRKKSAANAHLGHLKRVHGIPIKRKGKIYEYDFEATPKIQKDDLR